MSWKKVLETAKESLNDHLRLRNEYLMAESRILLRNQIGGRVQRTDSEVWSGIGLVMSYLLSFIHFSRQQVQSVRMTLHHQMLASQALIRRSFDLSCHIRKWSYLIRERSPTSQREETGKGQPVSGGALADV
jgi:hypothetical protein